jgi:rhamnosyltransferase
MLTKNNGQTLDEVLGAIFNQETAQPFEVIHVDSGSTDNTLTVADRYACRRYQIPSADFSHSATRNFAASLSRGELVVYVSADAAPAGPGWLEQLIAPLREPSVAGVYGRQIPLPDANVIEAYFLERTYSTERRSKQLAPGQRLTLEDLFFSNVTSAIRRSVWERHPFDERLHMSEDQAWARDALRAGYAIVYEPEAAVLHSHNYTFGKLFRRNFDSGHSLAVLLEGEDISFVNYGAGYLVRELVDFTRAGHARHLPYLLVYEMVRAAGFFLGRNATRLPQRVRRSFSDYKAYWDRFESPARRASTNGAVEARR